MRLVTSTALHGCVSPVISGSGSLVITFFNHWHLFSGYNVYSVCSTRGLESPDRMFKTCYRIYAWVADAAFKQSEHHDIRIF